MKTVINSVIAGLLIFELLSPFLIGYLNAATKTTYVIKTEKANAESKPKACKQTSDLSHLDLFDESYSDSKSLKIREMIGQGK